MTEIQSSVLIRADIQKVFAYASDWSRWEEWFEGVSGFEPTTEVERGNGARYLYKASLMGLPATVETRIHDFVEDSGWTGVATKGFPHRTGWLFQPEGGGTRFIYTLEYRMPVPVIGPVLDALVLRKQWQRILDTSLANLKRHLEKDL